jgi:trimeric autotransporter adhesin
VRRSFGKLPKRTGWQPALPQKRPRRQFNLEKLARFFGNFPPMKITIPQFLIALLIVCFGLLPKAQAVIPAPDGGYFGGNTAEGENAFLSLTTGGFNTAVGFLSLRAITTGSLNTAIGAGTLLVNTADENTATGAGALLSNTTGFQNTATGTVALFSNIDGTRNTANGADALFNNTTGNGNTATGSGALQNNTTGFQNTVSGASALESNTTGSNNIALGFAAGFLQTNGSSNVYIGAVMPGIAGESDACYIRSIFGQTSANGIPVLINSSNKLGTTTSSKRFKEDIKPMDKASEALFALKPVCFRYKKEIDPVGISQLGLVAEDVEKVNPDLVVRDTEGKPYTVRYEQINAMLLNEFLKEHRKVEDLKKDFQATVARQQKEIAALAATVKEQASQIQKVSAQLEASKPASQVVNNP